MVEKAWMAIAGPQSGSREREMSANTQLAVFFLIQSGLLVNGVVSCIQGGSSLITPFQAHPEASGPENSKSDQADGGI